MLIMYVDDILISGNNQIHINEIINNLKATFALKDMGDVNVFLGFEVHRNAAGLYLSQKQYTEELLRRANMDTCKHCETPASTSTKLSTHQGEPFENPKLYRSIIGGLQYLCNTRPDISHPVNKLSQFLKEPKNTHWVAYKRILRYLKGTLDVGLHFKPCSQPLNLEAYSDADWGGLVDDRKSTSGGCVFLGENLISWTSKKQSVVARSSTEAEYRSLTHLATEVIWVTHLLKELDLYSFDSQCFTRDKPELMYHPVNTQTPIIWCDNQSALSLAQNPVFHSRTKHFEIDLHFIRDKVADGCLDIRYVSTEDQVADLLTKPLSVARFNNLVAKLNLTVNPKFRLRGSVRENEIGSGTNQSSLSADNELDPEPYLDADPVIMATWASSIKSTERPIVKAQKPITMAASNHINLQSTKTLPDTQYRVQYQLM